MSKRYGFTILMAALLMNGCAAQGARVERQGTFEDTTYTLSYSKNKLPKYFYDPAKYELDYVYVGDLTSAELAGIEGLEENCRLYTKDKHPARLVAVFSSGTLYAIAGFVGVGGGSQAFTGAKFMEYGPYGAAASGAGGLANGIIMLGGMEYTFQNCARETLDLLGKGNIRPIQGNPY